jgi:hypothetical protein
VDHDKLGRLKVSTSLENAELPEKVVSVVAYSHEKRGLDFGWHQVARKCLTVGQGFGRDHGGSIQQKGLAFDVASSVDSRS